MPRELLCGLLVAIMAVMVWLARPRRRKLDGERCTIVRRASERETERRAARDRISRQRVAAYRAAVERGECPEAEGRMDSGECPESVR